MWYERLYVGESVNQKRIKKIKERISHNKKVRDIYCLCVIKERKYELLIISSQDLLREKKYHEGLMIVGIARGKDEAMALTVQMIQEIFTQTKDVKIKEYFIAGDKDEQMA